MSGSAAPGVCGRFIVVGAMAAACSFSTAGKNNPDLELGEEGDSGASEAGDDRSSATSGGEEGGDPATTHDSVDDTGSAATATEDGAASEDGPADGEASLVFLGAPLVDFGDVTLDGNVLGKVSLHNAGTGTATALAGAVSGAPLGLEGGVFPGTTGTCGAELAPGAVCDVALVGSTGFLGPTTRELTVTYDAGTGAAQTSLTLAFAGLGESANLLVNGDGESGSIGLPPPGWSAAGSVWTATSQFALGTRSISAGYAGDGNETFLRQDIDLGAYADQIDAGGFGIELTGVGRAFEPGNDPMWFRVVDLDANGGESEEATSAPSSAGDWSPLSHTRPTPVGTRGFRLELYCVHLAGNSCSAYFDDLEVRLVYPGPPG